MRGTWEFPEQRREGQGRAAFQAEGEGGGQALEGGGTFGNCQEFSLGAGCFEERGSPSPLLFSNHGDCSGGDDDHGTVTLNSL